MLLERKGFLLFWREYQRLIAVSRSFLSRLKRKALPQREISKRVRPLRTSG